LKADGEDGMMGKRIVLGAVLLSMACSLGAKEPKAFNAKKFDGLATAALAAMRAKAEELKIGGVAVVNFATSMGNNLLGVDYA
jgi:hypothetical protein